MRTLLLLLLTLWALPARARAAYDPFAPAAPAFPRVRLLRAGVDEETVARLADEFSDMSRRQQTELARFVTRHTDRAIVRRYQGRRTKEELERLRVEQIEDLLRERDLSTSGRKAELIDRLVSSYDAPKGALTGNPVPVVPETPPEPPQTGSGDDSGQAPPSEQPAPDTAPAPVPEATPGPGAPPDATTPEQAPPGPGGAVSASPPVAPPTETPAATPAPDTATPADTPTTEEAPRG